MWSNTDNSGLFTLVIGVVALVMVTIGLGVIVDKRLGFSSQKISNQEDIAAHNETIEDLRHQLERLEDRYSRGNAHVKQTATENNELHEILLHSTALLNTLRDKRPQLSAEIKLMEQDFVSYRNQYRSQTWASAIGEKHAKIEALDGKIYEDVTIRNITEAGINISHKQGLGRLSPDRLGPTWQSRFQWNEEARSKLLKEESDKQKAHDVAQKITPIEEPVLTKDQILHKAQSTYLLSRKRYFTIRSEYRQAHYKQATQNGRSVPGELATWDQRIAALKPHLDQSQKLMIAAAAELRTLSPNDPLLNIQSTD